MNKAIGYTTGILAIALAGAAAGVGGYLRYSGPPSTELRWGNETDIAVRSTDTFNHLLHQSQAGGSPTDKDPADKWRQPTVSVYSTPYVAPHPAQVTLKDLSDNGQAHAIDVVFKRPVAAKTAWQDLMNTVSDSAGATERVDPYRVNRVLIATVVKGLDTLPGDRILWTRVFVQPINFEFAGYTIAATDSRSVEIAKIENSTNARLSIGGGADADLPGVTKPDVAQSIERSQKASANVNQQYENLGVDIQRNFLRIIRESAPGGDVAGNSAFQLSMLTDPRRIWCDNPDATSCEPRSRAGVVQDQGNDDRPDDRLVLFVSGFHPSDGDAVPKIAVLPQNPLPHCPLIANVWMLYETRTIVNGRQNYVEGSQQVELKKDGYNAGKVTIVDADDIAPAVWSIKVTDPKNKTPLDDMPDLKGLTENGTARKLVFTDYLTASELAHWLKTQLAKDPDSAPKIKPMTFQVDRGKTLTPFKHVTNDCIPQQQRSASR